MRSPPFARPRSRRKKLHCWYTFDGTSSSNNSNSSSSSSNNNNNRERETPNSAPQGDRLDESANGGTNSRSGRLGRVAEIEGGVCKASAKPPIRRTRETNLRRQLGQRLLHSPLLRLWPRLRQRFVGDYWTGTKRVPPKRMPSARRQSRITGSSHRRSNLRKHK